jgi:antitoxin component of RelBE/YafQ-DinJ toxin-antitoxin module
MSAVAKTIIQVPVSKSLRDQAAAAVKELGFSSIQESIRLFLTQMADRSLSFSFKPKPVKLSPKAIKRYNKILDDIESGKEPVYEAKNVNDLLDQLYGKKDPVQSKISSTLPKTNH